MSRDEYLKMKARERLRKKVKRRKDRSKKRLTKEQIASIQLGEKQLQGDILEDADRYNNRSKLKTHLDLNREKANFPMLDGATPVALTQAKAHLAKSKKGRVKAAQSLMSSMAAQPEKTETLAKTLGRNKGQLLRQLSSKRKRKYFPPPVSKIMRREMKKVKDDDGYEADTEAIAEEMDRNTVFVAPDDVVKATRSLARKKRKTLPYKVRGAGISSEEIKDLMTEIGYKPSSSKGDDDEDYDPNA